MGRYQVRESIEPLDVGLQVAGLLEVLVARVQVVLGEGLDELLWAYIREFLQLDVCQLLGHDQRTLTDLGDVCRLWVGEETGLPPRV